MADATKAADLQPLEDTYRIVGEVRTSGSTRRFVATRIADAAAVMISVVATPVGGDDPDNNELSHFAADAKLLASVHHPAILPVLDGRWVGDRFAVVTERTNGTTLQDELDRHAEFRNPRIAMVLQEIWSGLECAREQGVVHRWVTPDSVYFEPKTKRVRVVLSPAPIPMTGVPGAAADSRTIGTLAWAMLAGAPFDAAKSGTNLIELAPNLATRVVEAVEQMVGFRDADPAPDVPTSLGIIAAGDVLKQGEVEIQAVKEEYDERHRLELEKCENHRQEVEQYASEQASIIVDEREALERLAAEQAEALVSERTEIERLMNAREERIAALRANLERQAERAAKGVEVEAVALRDAAPARQPPSKQSPPTQPSRRPLRVAAIAAGVVGVAAAAWFFYERGSFASSSNHESAERTTAAPTTPAVDTTRGQRGGFLSQSAGGNVAPQRGGPPLATARDSAIAVADSIRADSVARRAARDSAAVETVAHKPRPRPRPTEPANDVNGVIPRSSVADTLRPAPDSARRDSGVPVDTTFRRDTSIPRGTNVRPDSVRRDTMAGRPGVRVETTFVRGTVRRDTTGRPPY